MLVRAKRRHRRYRETTTNTAATVLSKEKPTRARACHPPIDWRTAVYPFSYHQLKAAAVVDILSRKSDCHQKQMLGFLYAFIFSVVKD